LTAREPATGPTPASGAPTGRDPARELAELDAIFKALAHPQRRHVLLVLHFRGGEMSAGDIARRFACSWPTTTRHLKVLNDAGLVQVVPRGRERWYRVDRERLQRVVGDWLLWFDRAPLSVEPDPASGQPD